MSIHQPIGELLDKQKIIPINRLEAGDIIIEHLKELEVEYVFGVPGGAIEPIFNALARGRLNNGAKLVVARHEAGAAFMADGYARESGKLGVCIATSGPGATNMITGVASAYQDQIPMLAITGQPQLSQFGNRPVQESSCTGIDIVAMFKHCTAYSSLVSHPDQLEQKLISAVIAAYQYSCPVHLSIPVDIASHTFPFEPSRKFPPIITNQNNVIDIEKVDKLSEQLTNANRPVFILGEGCKQAVNEILNYCKGNNVSFVSTPQGKGLINPYHPNFYGVCGLAGHETAINLLNSNDTDLVVIIGTMLDQFATCNWQVSGTHIRKYIHIDSNSDNFSRSKQAILNVFGNIKSIFAYLNKPPQNSDQSDTNQRKNGINKNKAIPFERRRLCRRKQESNFQGTEQRFSDRRASCSMNKPLLRQFRLIDELKSFDDSTPIKPQRLMYELSSRAPDNARFLADMGNSFLWAIHYLNPHPNYNKNNYNYLSMGMGFASMAWCISAAVGIALANPKAPVICIAGDGSFLMSPHELTVAVQLELPIVYVVLNDQAYGMVKHGQKLAGAESIGSELPPTDFASYAQAIGAKGITVKSPGELEKINLPSLFKGKCPILIDMYIDGDESPPLSDRIKMIASGHSEH